MPGRKRSVILRIGLAIGLVAAFPTFSPGQGAGVPILSGVSPPGATIGQTTRLTVTGRNLARVVDFRVSGEGVEVLGCKPDGETSAQVQVRVARDAQAGTREVRLDGPAGISNLALFRLDRLEQVAETEPNDLLAQGQVVRVGQVVAGVVKPLDIDHFRVEGKPGERLTIDLESRRIGTSIAPVVTVFSTTGAALEQHRESRGGDLDCRFPLVLPAGGACIVQIRDNQYRGGDQAAYRLRIDPAPFATAIFPLGGPKGQSVEVELSGGNLASPRRKSVRLPEGSGSVVDPGDFDGADGPVSTSARLVAGEGPEWTEPQVDTNRGPIDLPPVVTVNGRISHPGENDIYRLPVKAGQNLQVRVEAAALGSWLDSVVFVRDSTGAILVENDDPAGSPRTGQARSVSSLGIPGGSTDSAVEVPIKADGLVTIEVVDRFGDGGPEYGYRLAIGPEWPDFGVTLLLGNASGNALALANLGQVRTPRTSQGQFGVLNLKPGATTPINFLVTPSGQPGPVEVRAEGLPIGVSAEPVQVRFPSSGPSGPARSEPVSDLILLRVEPYAAPGLGEFRLVATASPSPGVTLSREGTAMIGVDLASLTARPINRAISHIPLRIIGSSRPLFVGPPAPPTLKSVGVPGPLLLGDQLDLALDFEGTVSADDGSTIEAKAEGVGLATSTVVSAGTSVVDDEAAVPDVTVHVLASIKAKPGPYVVKVAYTPLGGPTALREVTIEVKAPIEVNFLAGEVSIRPGDFATFPVEVRRETGFLGEVELKLEGLPRGVKLAKPVTIPSGVTRAEVRVEMGTEVKPLAKPTELRVVGMARMPRGNVSVDSKLRPMIRPRPADK